MKIIKIETFHCDGGWRPWTFIKISTDRGITGFSECTDSHGSPLGIEGIIKDMSNLLIGKDPRNIEELYWQLYSRTRQSPGGIIQKAIGGIENALLDIKAKEINIPVYDLFGGPVRKQIELYWSHCVTSRVRAWKDVAKKQIKSLDNIAEFAEEIKGSGYRAIKTNIPVFEENPFIYMPGFFKSIGGPELNLSGELLNSIVAYIKELRRALGNEIEIILDLNFNFKPEGYKTISRHLEEFNLLWLELDCYDPMALQQIKQSTKIPICSGENLYGARSYKPHITNYSLDIASIDIIWNGFVQSKKIADFAEVYEINVTPHNYYSHLATFISAQFSSVVPNLRLMEVDVDDVPWKDDIITKLPQISNGIMTLSKESGWGADLNEDVIRKHPWIPYTKE